MVYLTLCLWEEIGLVWPGPTIAKIPSTEQDGVFNVMSMGRNWSSLAWMTTTRCAAFLLVFQNLYAPSPRGLKTKKITGLDY